MPPNEDKGLRIACEKVIAYEVVGDVVQAIADGPATLPIIKGTVHGRDAVVLPDDAADAMERPGGVRAWFEKGYDAVRDAATDVSERVSSAAKKVKASAESAEGKAVPFVVVWLHSRELSQVPQGSQVWAPVDKAAKSPVTAAVPGPH